METARAASVFESLASGVRLEVVRLLVKTGPQGLVAGDIAAALQLPPTNLSFHLKALVQSSLIGVEPQGRYLRYRANMALLSELIQFLVAECCQGQPDQCLDVPAAHACLDCGNSPLPVVEGTSP